ncbi:hypothetical protein [Rufibacter sp. LB8]|uniref:hypothetical protein n=1 Tax=Rufibacter sp. LB8 TaxID=2777781 RepID=UPI00178C66E9|nr:hypothetical protein [Rufibacter sp. LB8]
MKLKILLCCVLLCVGGSAVGQVNPIQQEILNYPESPAELISKGRRLILDRFLAGDAAKVRQVKNYLLEHVEDENYVALLPIERWYLGYWTKDYLDVLPAVLHLDSVGLASFRGKIFPMPDMLLEKLETAVRDSKAQIVQDIKNADLRTIDKEYLLLHLEFMLARQEFSLAERQNAETMQRNPEAERDTLNAMANRFLSNYPQSQFEPFIRSNIREAYVPAKLGFTYEIFSGFGVFTKGLSHNFSNTVPIGISFEAYLRRWAFSTRAFIGFGNTRKDFPYENGVWPTGSRMTAFTPEFDLGYVVAENKRLKLTPFIGIAATKISPEEEDNDLQQEYRKAEFGFTTTYAVGTALDIKLGQGSAYTWREGGEERYLFVRLRYAFLSPQFSSHYSGLNGYMHHVTVGFGGFWRFLKRDY